MHDLEKEARVIETGRFASPSVNSQKIYLASKRILDMTGALFGIVLLFPVFIVVAILIKFEDPKGPVLFKQLRMGKNGKPFYMYKFRSMVANAEDLLEHLLDKNEVDGLMFKIKGDPRVTRVGKIIRKTSLDELPQFFNVLKGEMSLVGPRPPLPREVKEYNTYHWKRLEVAPGCTGLWQVSDRNSVGFEEMVLLDLHYIQNRSIIYDMKIILMTVRVLFGSKNAF